MFVNLVHRVKQALNTGVQAVRKQLASRADEHLPRTRKPARSRAHEARTDRGKRLAPPATHRAQPEREAAALDQDRPLAPGPLSSRVRTWKDALLIVKPDTLLRWHRQGFRLFWRRKSRAGSRAPRIPAGTIALIQEMAGNNRLWGVKRI